MLSTIVKGKLVRDLSANSFQTIATQVLTLGIFYILSKYLPKEHFGEFNWSVALAFTLISAASLGLDLVYVKKVAAGEDVITVAGLHFFHCLLAGTVLTAAVFVVYLLFPGFAGEHPLFLLLFINAALINTANSFRLCLNGLERYKRLALLATASNLVKLVLIIVILFTGRFSVYTVIASYFASSVLELVLGYFLVSRAIRFPVRPLLKVTEYKLFILESLPQLGVMIFDSTLSRIDIILLGVLSTASVTAEYSFAYKIYELSRLPVLIIGPVLLTRFSRAFSRRDGLSPEKVRRMQDFFTLEFFLMMFVPLILLCLWSPVMDYFTDGKYGRVNELTYTILAFCVPLAGLINLYWTLGFVQGQMKTVLLVTMGVAVLNVVLNLLLIPVWQATGAAISFLVSTVAQAVLYALFTDQSRFNPRMKECLFLLAAAIGSAIIGKLATGSHLGSMLIALLAYLTFTVAGGIIKKDKIEALRGWD